MEVFKATKKPVTIEAIRFVETSRTQRKFGVSIEHNGMEVARFIGKPTRFPTVPDGTPQGKIVAVIETLEGDMHAELGDYIIKGVQGEFYPCKPEIFNATYNIHE
ncbi:hypothetical protein NVP1118B_68 [Vibrio phage 1.118.B._10N.261.49.F6]|nr:hypothetical protein NVP1118A_68 [Vibrio phage 1.118.A._10N.261.49.F6]AUR88924.1 hypothetical protein NVP1118B_68 [Vibrio phage 1.118.B._10N.261.49.F6]